MLLAQVLSSHFVHLGFYHWFGLLRTGGLGSAVFPGFRALGELIAQSPVFGRSWHPGRDSSRASVGHARALLPACLMPLVHGSFGPWSGLVISGVCLACSFYVCPTGGMEGGCSSVF